MTPNASELCRSVSAQVAEGVGGLHEFCTPGRRAVRTDPGPVNRMMTGLTPAGIGRTDCSAVARPGRTPVGGAVGRARRGQSPAGEALAEPAGATARVIRTESLAGAAVQPSPLVSAEAALVQACPA